MYNMIKKDKYTSELLTQFNEIIKEKMNLDLAFITKELIEGYTIEKINKHQFPTEKNQRCFH